MMEVFVACAGLVAVTMTAWFVVALIKKDNSVADIAWGLGFVLVALFTLFDRSVFSGRQILVSGMVCVWGLRLAAYILIRNRKRGEDSRYAALRAKWGRGFALRSYFQVFLLQGLFLIVISSSVIVVNSSPQGPLGALDLAGTVVWVTGFVFESAGDAQLARFKRDPANRGRIMDRGLWRYTRHPNYFGESLMWWGIFLVALEEPYGWTTVASPVLITFLLVRVSGISLLEKRYAGNAEFQAYARKTNAFVPGWPRKPRSESRTDAQL
jgi:steroid 5-alpha reductase family enzyme